MGLRYVKGLKTTAGERIAQAAGAAPFTAIEDFVARTRLDEGALVCLAEAGALDSLDPGRRSALWAVRGASRRPASTLPLPEVPEPVTFPALTGAEQITWDYRTGGHSTRGHPMAALRQALRARGLPDARTVAGLQHGSRAHYVGAVINRQRPGTAQGVVFMTLEDETGFVNLVVWSRVFDRFSLVARTCPVLGVTGTIQAQEGVVHLVAQRLWEPQLALRPETVKSRDFR